MSGKWRNIIINTILAIALYIYFVYSESSIVPDISENLLSLLLTIILINISGFIILFISRRLNKIMPWNKQITVRFFSETGIILAVFLIIGIAAIKLWLEHTLPVSEESSFFIDYRDAIIKYLIISVVGANIFSIINFSVFSFNQYSVVRIAAMKLDKEQKSLQFDSLKNQLSPHYLFNSLNTISALIYKDTGLAETFIRNLTKTYNYILNTNKHRLVTVNDELTVIHSYFSMQKIKYENLIDLKIDLTPEIKNTFIPPLCLQILLENSFKHNGVSDENHLTIKIFTENNEYLVVSNNIIQKQDYSDNQDNKSYKMGLENISKRYKYFTDKNIIIDADDNSFIVKLPLILKKQKN